MEAERSRPVPLAQDEGPGRPGSTPVSYTHLSIDTPPPTVSGSLHIGHVFSYTQAEMIARFKRMQGYDVFYPFGFDDNGLPTERLVERDGGFHAADMRKYLLAIKLRG